jgi:dipeptidyl aminopeptidase/acylaminoacyl peptidase
VKPADLALLRTPGPPTVSSEGRHAVVAVTRLDLDADEYRSQLWLLPTDGSAPPRQITRGVRDTAPAFSPDGRWLAFLRAESGGRPQLHVMPTDAGEPWRVTERKHHPLGAGAPEWSPDSARIGYIARVPEPGRYGTTEGVTPEKEPPRRISMLKFRWDDVGFTFDRRPHVFVVDPFVAEPEPTQLTDGDYDDEEVAWSPDGRRLAFLSARHEDRDTTLYSDVYTSAAGGGDLVKVTPTTLSAAGRPAFTPDGREVVFLAHGLGPSGNDFVARNLALWAAPADGSAAPRQLTDGAELDLTDCGNGLRVDGDGVLVGAQWRGAVELLRVPLDATPAGPRPPTVLHGHRQVTGYAAAAGRVVATVADPRSSGEVVAIGPGGRERTLTGSFFAEAYAGADPARVAAQSPLSYADKIEIPVLIIHSEQDWRCPVEQAQRLFVALKARGVPAELLLFPGEGHELSRSGLPSHRLARFEAILGWWSRHLSTVPAAVAPAGAAP